MVRCLPFLTYQDLQRVSNCRNRIIRRTPLFGVGCHRWHDRPDLRSRVKTRYRDVTPTSLRMKEYDGRAKMSHQQGLSCKRRGIPTMTNDFEIFLLLCLAVSAASLVGIAVGLFKIRDALVRREPKF